MADFTATAPEVEPPVPEPTPGDDADVALSQSLAVDQPVSVPEEAESTWAPEGWDEDRLAEFREQEEYYNYILDDVTKDQMYQYFYLEKLIEFGKDNPDTRNQAGDYALYQSRNLMTQARAWRHWRDEFQEDSRLEPKNSLDAMSQAFWNHPLLSPLTFTEDLPETTDVNESEAFDAWATRQVNATAQNLGAEAADELANDLQENRRQYINEFDWMNLDEAHRPVFEDAALDIYESVWSNAERHYPAEGMTKRFFDVALGVAGLDPVVTTEGIPGFISGAAVTGLSLFTLYSGMGFGSGSTLNKLGRAYTRAGWGGYAMAARGAQFAAERAQNEFGIHSMEMLEDQPFGFQYTPEQQSYILGRAKYGRPTGPREGYVPFLYADFAGWRIPFFESMRSVDIQRSRDLWRNVDGVGTHLSYYTPFPDQIDEEQLNNARARVWEHVEELRTGSGSNEIFIDELLTMDRALQSKVSSLLLNAAEQQNLLVGYQVAQALQDRPEAANWFTGFLRSWVPREGSQDVSRIMGYGEEEGITPLGAEGTRLGELQAYIDILQQDPNAVAEARDMHASLVIQAHSYQEIQRTLGAYLSHYQTGGSGRLDRHVATFTGAAFDELLNPALQAPGANFHQGYVAPGQLRQEFERSMARMPDEAQDPSLHNVEGAPQFVSDSYMRGYNSRRALQMPMAELAATARSSGDENFSHVANLVYSAFQQDFLPTFQDDYWLYDPAEGGEAVASWGYSRERPARMRPWQDTGELERIPNAHAWGLVVRPNDKMLEIMKEASELEPEQRQLIVDVLTESFTEASRRRGELAAYGAMRPPGASRALSEMYRNAYGSDAQTLRVLLSAVEGDSSVFNPLFEPRSQEALGPEVTVGGDN